MPAVDYGQEMKPAREQLLDLLSDLNWHSRHEMGAVAGNRYSARVLELKRLGYVIEARPIEGGDGQEYRLVSLVPGEPVKKRVKIFMDESDVIALLHHDVLTQSARSVLTESLDSFQANRNKL